MFYRLGTVALLIAFMSACPTPSSAMDEDNNPDVSVTEITDQSRVNSITQHFQDDLKMLGSTAQITGCKHVVDYVDHNIGGHDSSYGALCMLSNGDKKLQNVFMCDDVMIGKFTLGWSAYSLTKEGVGEFIGNNCPPGG